MSSLEGTDAVLSPVVVHASICLRAVCFPLQERKEFFFKKEKKPLRP